MPIEALPQATARAIGSTSVLSDPYSVVKELIDNALDASASSVSIEISQNTVDVIQVKDNGNGIPTEDHPCVCKHAFTSKISTIDDLKNVGGASLGFRGEALASVAEMSGGVSVTTRVASDIVASALEYGRDGELTRTQKTSHPIGTTVRIRDFLKDIPVRRQATLKGATKCLAKFKSLIQAYAMAQPSKRFSLRVLKAKNEINNWSFVPASDLTLADAAMKVVGRDAASSCSTKEFTSRANSSQHGANEQPYKVTALLPRPDADFTKINNKGQFLSIDGRPLSTSRGIGRDIVKLFKSHIRAATLKSQATKSVSDPFLCLQLNCPLGSYDVNIEPGKDDVLFENRELVFSLIQTVLTDHYGTLPDEPMKSPAKKATSSTAVKDHNGFGLLMARRPVQFSQISRSQSSSVVDIPLLGLTRSRRPLHSPTASCPQQPPDNERRNEGLGRDQASEGVASRQINPWSISQINASFQATNSGDASSFARQTCEVTSPEGTIQRHSPQRPTSSSPPQISALPSPVLSRLTPVSPVNRRQNPPTPQESPLQSTSSASASRRAARERDRQRYGNGALDTCFQRTTQASYDLSSAEAQVKPEEAVPSFSQLGEQRFNPKPNTSLENDNPLLMARLPKAQTPDPSPHQVGGIASPETGHGSNSMENGRGFPVLENWAASIHEGFTPESSSELEKALDFERRKRAANQRHRTLSGQLRTTTKAPTPKSPYKNRHLAAKTTLNADSSPKNDPSTPTGLCPGDPRAYLMSLQTEQLPVDQPDDSVTIRRTRTSRLPLERIPEGYDLHSVRLSVKTCPTDIPKSLHITALYDGYTRGGDEHEPLLSPDVTTLLHFWNERLSTLISNNYKTNENLQTLDLRIDIGTAVENLAQKFRPTESQSD